MRSKIILILFFFIVNTSFILAVDFLPNQILIKVKQPLDFTQTKSMGKDPILNKYKISDIRKTFHLNATNLLKTKSGKNLEQVYTIVFSENVEMKSIINEFKKCTNISWVQPNFIYKKFLNPNDTYYSRQLNIPLINGDKAWDYLTIGNKYIVAVVDTGADYLHEDLKDNIWINTGEIPDNGIDDDSNGYVDDYQGWNFVSEEPPAKDPMDKEGHGTFVSGIITARLNNNLGIAGIAGNSPLMIVKAGDSEGSFTTETGSAGIRYAADNNAKVINLSWGGKVSESFDDKILEEAVAYAVNRKCIIVSAAGNERTDIDYIKYIPANYPGVYAISAVDNDGEFDSSYSNYGSRIDFSAPGTNILSTILSDTHSTYYYDTGTSFSAPTICAGIIAILNSNANADVYEVLKATAQKKTNLEKDPYYGYGIIDVYKAISYANRNAVKINHTSVNSGNLNTDLCINAEIYDTVFTKHKPTSVLMYSVNNGVSWKETSFVLLENNVYQATIPGADLSSPTLNYYIKSFEIHPSYNVTLPINAPNKSYTVLLVDQVGPEISSQIKNNDYINQNEPLIFSISDNRGVSANTILLTLTNNNNVATFNINSTEISFSEPVLTFSIKDLTLQKGTTKINLTAKDLSNNVSNAYELTVQLTDSEDDLILTGPTASSPILNYPNPFNPQRESTDICYMVNKSANITILIYSLNMQLVKRIDTTDTSGYHTISWNGKDMAGDYVPAGGYLYVIKATDNKKTIVKRSKIAIKYF